MANIKALQNASGESQTISLPYSDKTRQSLLTALRMSIVVWGLFPMAACLLGVVGLFYSELISHDPANRIRDCFLIMSGLVIPTLFLLAIRNISKSSLLLDKNGMEVPCDLLSTTLKPQYIPWNTVNKIAFNSSDKGQKRNQDSALKNEQIVLYLKQQQPVVIKLDRLDIASCEKLLVCFDVFAAAAERESLGELSNLIRSHLRQQANQNLAALAKGDVLSHTELWEDELNRRFRAAAFMPLEPGVIMRNGSLTVLRQLALGGLSAVYLGQLENNSLVVLKESVVPVDAKVELKDKAREMFAREANLLIKLQHPNIVPVLDYFVENSRSYLLLDYISGQDLRQYVKQNGRVREGLVLQWAHQIAVIIDYLHKQEPPVIHRDLTPDNLVLRPDGTIVAIDFGAANEFIGNATGTFVGKQSYIAPEQFRGKASLQSDIYAFGGTLYYLLTGEDPEALSQSEPAKQIELSSQLNDLVKSCTDLELETRISSAAEIIQSLQRISQEKV
ncbi:MAG: serine/threonine-protein kinase [Candidatus Melainabacteria bacterium]|nr:serine/threonine-protein kinase [Candidatus Melainabacteria bacterium]